MNNIYQLEIKELEKRYGPAVAQYLCDELENTKRINEKNKNRGLIEAYGKNTIMYKAA